ncbi:MAG: MFS transporter, partial [Gammaproteobacteria bacterium]|nr:MFS transporter [Gammaproteobacteria bacterium]
LEFGDRDNRPARIAIANTVAQVAGSIGPLLGGAMATWYGYESVFIAAIFFLVVGATLVYFYVPEPRGQRAGSTGRVT